MFTENRTTETVQRGKARPCYLYGKEIRAEGVYDR